MISPTITIAIPVYNVEKYVERSLLSALNQDITVPYEILILDDQGTDNSIKIVNRIKQEHEQGDIIRIIVNQKNKGQGETRNTAIDETHSKYLYFLDSDDWMTPDCLRLLYEKAEESDAEITHGSVDRIVENTNKIFLSSLYTNCTIEHEAVGLYLFLQRKPIHIECWNKLFRVDFLRKHNIRCTHRVMEDVVFEFRCACLAHKYAFVPQVTMNYYVREGSTLTEVRGKKGNDHTAFAFSDIPHVLRECIKNEFSKINGVWDYYAYKVMDMCRNLADSTYTETQQLMIKHNLKGMMTEIPSIRYLSEPVDRFMYAVCLFKENYHTYNYFRNIYWVKHQALLKRIFGSWPTKIKKFLSV